MILKKRPKNFNPRFEVVSCYVEHDGEILLLHRHDHKSEGGKWGVPAGKMEKDEDKHDAMIREIREETGIQLTVSDIQYLTTVFVRFQEYEFVYHMFSTKLTDRKKITLSTYEHKAFVWISPNSALSLPLVTDLDGCIKMFYET